VVQPLTLRLRQFELDQRLAVTIHVLAVAVRNIRTAAAPWLNWDERQIASF